MRSLVIVPTYNEVENIRPLVTEIFAAVTSAGLGTDFAVLVVDDNSPDGTGKAVQELQKSMSFGGLHLLSRPGKHGLGRAYIAGFKWGLEQGYEVLVEMDADFSHRPVDLVKLLTAVRDGADFAIGSAKLLTEKGLHSR